MVRSIATCVVMLACVVRAGAEEVVRNISWRELTEAHRLVGGEVPVSDTEGTLDQLKIDVPPGEPATVALLVLDNPGVSTGRYAVTGSVRYEQVNAKSYLEMWSRFADGSEYFSRTLGDAGLMQCLEGSSDWRPFSLPFSGDKRLGAPVRLTISAVVADGGTVYVSPLTLVQYGDAWWTERSAVWIGGVGGSVIGLFGALIGVLAGMGKARRFVLLLTVLLTIVGVAGLVLGGVALLVGQPYCVYYPLLLAGVILAAVCGGNFRILRRRYVERELRKMSALDAG